MDVDVLRQRTTELLGTPFKLHGRLEEDGAMDCFGLARELWRVAGHELPDPGRVVKAEQALQELGDYVTEVTLPIPGAIMVVYRPGRPIDHVAVYLGGGVAAQARERIGVFRAKAPKRTCQRRVRYYVPRTR